MTDTTDLRVARARKAGDHGFADYLETRAQAVRPARFVPEPPPADGRCTAVRSDGATCIRGHGHTGPHLPPRDPATHPPQSQQATTEESTA